MRALVLVVALVAQFAAAQVTNTCGPGKVCTVKSLRATENGAAAAALCVGGAIGTYDFSFTRSADILGLYAVGKPCTASAAVVPQTWNINSGAISFGSTFYGTGASYWSTVNGYSASLAFASFPACNGTIAGRLLYDSTNTVWRFCNGTSWLVMTREWTLDGYHPPNVVGSTKIQQVRVQSPGAVLRINATLTSAGVGAGNVTFEVYDVTSTTVLCTHTFPCTATVGAVYSTQCSGATYAALDDVTLRVATNACGTSPGFNVSATMGGG